MNREIKFRIWHDGWMSPSVGIKEMAATIIKHPEQALNFARTDSLLLQYTGLKDKNGVEIYEGDIVRYNTGEEWIVKWSPMYLRIVLVDNRKGYNLTQDLGAHEVEVIGNIYDNPELLEAKS